MWWSSANATPIHSEDGTVASVVVTMQDLAPLEELDRLRTEFLNMVSHELRTPLAAIKGSTATVLDASPVGARAVRRRQGAPQVFHRDERRIVASRRTPHASISGR